MRIFSGLHVSIDQQRGLFFRRVPRGIRVMSNLTSLDELTSKFNKRNCALMDS